MFISNRHLISIPFDQFSCLLQTAREILAAAEQADVKVLLPLDNVLADAFAADAKTQLASGDFPPGWMGMDIGPATVRLFSEEIAKAKTIIWNGPVGCFELPPFAAGTSAVCRAVAAAGALSIIGGGDSARAVNESGLADRMSHVSTGGGAALVYLEGGQLPGVVALDDK